MRPAPAAPTVRSPSARARPSHVKRQSVLAVQDTGRTNPGASESGWLVRVLLQRRLPLDRQHRIHPILHCYARRLTRQAAIEIGDLRADRASVEQGATQRLFERADGER